MTTPGDGEPYRAQPNQPWQQYSHPPVDPQAPLNYPDDPYPTPPYPRPYGPPGYGGPPPPPYGGYGGPPPMYPGGVYDPYHAFPSQQTNSLAIASLITAITGVVLGVPLAVFCYVGWLIPVIAAAMGAVALNQIKQSGQQGRGMALAGIIIGALTAGLLVLGMIVVAAAAFHSPMFGVI